MNLIGALALPAPSLVPLVVWFIAQTSKIVIAQMRRSYSLATYLSPGGMPSVHAATTSSIATTVLLLYGWRSPIFGLAFVVFGLAVYDALVLRNQAGKHATALNRVQRHLFSAEELEQLKEILGHRPFELFVGMVLGIVLALLLTPIA